MEFLFMYRNPVTFWNTRCGCRLYLLSDAPPETLLRVRFWGEGTPKNVMNSMNLAVGMQNMPWYSEWHTEGNKETRRAVHMIITLDVIKAMLNSSGIALPGGQNVKDNHLMTLPPEVINSANRVLKMRVMHVFKGKSFLFPHVTIEVNTPLFDGRCGVNYLQPHKPYIIMGKLEGEGMLTFNSCNWHRKWMDITARQKKGFRHTYKTNCDCHVHTCGIGSKCGDREKNFPKVCDWDPFKGACYNKHAACVKTDKKRCEWSYPTEHTDCEFPSR
ncbi:Tissue inhibitor of metalloproteinase [Holothuria leucospilota]|uniref:Tissue inhibitor of metalloproteinase n=1 Tax=Holothuria leucospilota TaxID=206669 RepID=A0A9Q1CLL3_HOLLE|nr:Tissue inhibitor of metalloproteinase [Holothuria leucospilota]